MIAFLEFLTIGSGQRVEATARAPIKWNCKIDPAAWGDCGVREAATLKILNVDQSTPAALNNGRLVLFRPDQAYDLAKAIAAIGCSDATLTLHWQRSIPSRRRGGAGSSDP